MKFSKVLLAMLLISPVLASGCSGVLKHRNTIQIHVNDSFSLQGQLIQDFYTDKSAYSPGETVNFTLEVKNSTGKDFNGKIVFDCKSINNSVYSDSIDLSVQSGENKSLSFSWNPPNTDYKGYLVEAEAVSENKAIDHRNTAVDVSSSWAKYPRYGYLCRYPQMTESEISAVVERLSKYHINGVQFYDWQDSHDKPLAGTVSNPSQEWKDIAGRDTYKSTVAGYIAALHKKNMMASNYNLMYGAYDDFENRGIRKEWALYTDEDRSSVCSYQLPDNWESSLNLMNPAKSEWCNYILDQEKNVFDTYGFNEFHIDTLGNLGNVYDYNGNPVNLADSYNNFLSQVEKQLKKGFIVNTINEYGLTAAANSNADFLYSEVWPSSYANYEGLQRVVNDSFTASNNKKAVVIAAYVNYMVESGSFNPNAVKLTDAVLFASGASHLELGDTGMLSSEYFPNDKLSVPDELSEDLRSYYDFLTAYENILREPVESQEFSGSIQGYPMSDDGSEGTVWAFEKDIGEFKAIHLINLLSRSTNTWRDDDGSCESPTKISNFTVEIPDSGNVASISLASPDLFGGSMIPLDFTRKDGKIQVKVPSLEYWDMLLVQTTK